MEDINKEIPVVTDKISMILSIYLFIAIKFFSLTQVTIESSDNQQCWFYKDNQDNFVEKWHFSFFYPPISLAKKINKNIWFKENNLDHYESIYLQCTGNSYYFSFGNKSTCKIVQFNHSNMMTNKMNEIGLYENENEDRGNCIPIKKGTLIIKYNINEMPFMCADYLNNHPDFSIEIENDSIILKGNMQSKKMKNILLNSIECQDIIHEKKIEYERILFQAGESLLIWEKS